MANPLKQLVKDTALYGLSSIVGRFLNYLLVPLYTYRIAAESGGYGIVTNLYGYTALLLALLTFGMETTLFRFSNKEGENPDKVYGTTLRMVGGVALLFLVTVLCALKPISGLMGYSAHPEYIACMAAVVAMDAFQAIMFSRLRQQNKAVKFVLLKFAFIIPNILLNLFIFLGMPLLFGRCPDICPLRQWRGYDILYQPSVYGNGFRRLREGTARPGLRLRQGSCPPYALLYLASAHTQSRGHTQSGRRQDSVSISASRRGRTCPAGHIRGLREDSYAYGHSDPGLPLRIRTSGLQRQP